jgi:hypothetical protein
MNNAKYRIDICCSTSIITEKAGAVAGINRQSLAHAASSLRKQFRAMNAGRKNPGE